MFNPIDHRKEELLTEKVHFPIGIFWRVVLSSSCYTTFWNDSLIQFLIIQGSNIILNEHGICIFEMAYPDVTKYSFGIGVFLTLEGGKCWLGPDAGSTVLEDWL